jgi:xanthine dehydrogenase accessory factor
MSLESEAAATALDWLAEGHRVAAATLVATDGSAPLDPGATMLVGDDGRIEGSVTGGCVEGALFEEAQEVLAGGDARVRTYGIADSEAVSVGLMCGGTVHILVHELGASEHDALAAVAEAVAEGREAALATLLDGDGAGRKLALVDGRRVGGFGADARLDAAVERDALGCLANGASVIRRFGVEGQIMEDDVRVFIHAFVAPPRMVVFGAIDFSAAVARLAKTLGYSVTIVDARRQFAQANRFKVADEVVVDWPDRYLAGTTITQRDVILVFTHDPKFDEPALRAALETDAGYIGALGSRKTHADRTRRLRELGVSDDALERVASPCGLDIGARTPEETAVSILAEVIARSSGRGGTSLSEATGPIHTPRTVPAELA